VHLNAITQKGQYPFLVIDEFLDELKHASWFSTLDLCAGFLEIPMDPADSFKTTFQTHEGHYEFRVMFFGLTGAPHSFPESNEFYLSPLFEEISTCLF
jgi:hypothetical protein